MNPKNPGSAHQGLIPEFVGYPGLWDSGYVLEPDPTDGPENTIRLEVRSPGGTGIRYWMDPNRGYLVMRVEYLELRAGKYAVSTSADTLEVIQTPSGKWLPVLIRNNAGSMTLPLESLKSLPKEMIKDGRLRTEENYVRYFFQFENSISDDLFVIDDR